MILRCMYRISFLLFVTIGLNACESEEKGEVGHEVPTSLYYPVRVGDCFNIDSLPEFGILINKIVDYKNREEYCLVAVKLNKSADSLQSFTSGKTIVQSINTAFSETQQEGLTSFWVLSQNDAKAIFSHLHKIGNVKIKAEYDIEAQGTAVNSFLTLKQSIFQFERNLVSKEDADNPMLKKLGIKKRYLRLDQIITAK
ncbi:MAG: hypothetical protein JNL95_14790 [Chitinophagales bacterium]|nr:hypothetical protein [Chitinophagales bacterium]